MWTFLGSLIGGPVVNGLLKAYQSKLEAQNTRDAKAAELAVEDIRAEIARRGAQRDLGIAAMSHPVWWVAWGLFVIPVGLYHATIFILSTLGIGPETYAVLKVPADQQRLSEVIIQYLFLAQATAGVAGAVIKRLSR